MNDEIFEITFPYLIKMGIQRSRYSQRELSRLSGISLSTINRYATGDTTPSAKDLNKLIDILDLDVNQLFNPSDKLIDFIKTDIRLTNERIEREREERRSKKGF